MLAWNLESAFGAPAIIHKVSFDGPATNLLVNQLTSAGIFEFSNNSKQKDSKKRY